MSPGMITNPFILSCFFEDHPLPRVVERYVEGKDRGQQREG